MLDGGLQGGPDPNAGVDTWTHLGRLKNQSHDHSLVARKDTAGCGSAVIPTGSGQDGGWFVVDELRLC